MGLAKLMRCWGKSRCHQGEGDSQKTKKMRRMMEAAKEDHISDEDLAQVEEMGRKKAEITSEIKKVIVGQDKVIEEILIALFCRGHCLLVGVPGLAKTLLISTLAGIMELNFNRVQFTPDLMPSDITGTDILEEEREASSVRSVSLKGLSSRISFWRMRLTGHLLKPRLLCFRPCRSIR